MARSWTKAPVGYIGARNGYELAFAVDASNFLVDLAGQDLSSYRRRLAGRLMRRLVRNTTHA